MCRKCAKMCRQLKTEKSHEKSYDFSWDFGALVGTRIPGPLIKSQMLYRLSYERITILLFVRQDTARLFYHTRAQNASAGVKKSAFWQNGPGRRGLPGHTKCTTPGPVLHVSAPPAVEKSRFGGAGKLSGHRNFVQNHIHAQAAPGRNFLFTKGYKIVTMKDTECARAHRLFLDESSGQRSRPIPLQRRDAL